MKKVVWNTLLALVVVACAPSDPSSTPLRPNIDVTGPGKEVMPMQVTVKVSTDLGQVLHQRSPPTAESEALLNTVQASGLSLDPMHPGTEDPNLMTYFIVAVPDQARAQHLITRLRQLKGVEAAYLKPPDELP